MADCSHGIPDIYDMPEHYGMIFHYNVFQLSNTCNHVIYIVLWLTAGSEDCAKSFDASVWSHLMSHESSPPRRFFSLQFQQECNQFLIEEFGMSQLDITHANFEQTYLELVKHAMNG